MAAQRTHKLLASETPVSQFIPYSHHVTDTIISTKNADYLSVWKIGGRSHQSAAQEDVFAWVRELNNTLRGVASANLALWSHVIRRRVSEYPEAEFANSFCRTLDRKYRGCFSDDTLMVNDLYLTVIFRPVADTVLSFFARRERETPAQKTQRQDAAIRQLEEINQTLSASFRRYDAELLGVYAHNGLRWTPKIRQACKL